MCRLESPDAAGGVVESIVRFDPDWKVNDYPFVVLPVCGFVMLLPFHINSSVIC